jgi:hypothetical protein
VKRTISHAALISATIFGGMAAVGQQQEAIEHFKNPVQQTIQAGSRAVGAAASARLKFESAEPLKRTYAAARAGSHHQRNDGTVGGGLTRALGNKRSGHQQEANYVDEIMCPVQSTSSEVVSFRDGALPVWLAVAKSHLPEDHP